MKKYLVLLLLLLIFSILCFSAPALADSEDISAMDAAANTKQVVQELDTGELEEQLDILDDMLADQGSRLRLSELWEAVISGEQEFSLSMLWSVLGEIVFGQLRESTSILGQLLLLSLLAVMLTLLKNNFAGGQTAEIGRWVIYLLLIGLAAMAFLPCLERAKDTVELMRSMIYALLPMMVPLMASIGGLTTAALMNPAFLFALSLLLTLMSNFVFPLICFSALLKLCGTMAPRISLDKMSSLLKHISLGTMGIMVTVFIAFLSITGISAASTDGLAVKAIKSASGAFIPVVGRSLADAFDSVMGTAVLLKNGIGLIGAIAILLICIMPSVYILVQAIFFRITGALIQPLGEERLAEALSGMGSGLTMLFAALAITGLFAYFVIALMVGLGNITMMMR